LLEQNAQPVPEEEKEKKDRLRERHLAFNAMLNEVEQKH